MAGNRQAAQKFILKAISLLTRSSFNVKRLQTYFDSLTDKAFDDFMSRLEKGEQFLTIQAPNFSQVHLSVENNIAIAKELGLDFFQQVWVGEKEGVPAYLTPEKYLVADLPLRRASQTLVKKLSVADHNRAIDDISGQVAGDSKASKISYPELQVAAAMGLDASLIELIKYRGGDEKGAYALNGMMSKYGKASIKALAPYASGVRSTQTFKTYLNAAHLSTTL